MEVAIDLRRLDVQALEQKHLSRESQIHSSDGPIVIPDFGLIDLKVTSSIEVAKKSPSETNVFEQSAIDSRYVRVLRIHQHHSLHSDEHLLHVGGRIVVGIRTEFEPHQRLARLSYTGPAGFGAVILINKSVRQSFQDRVDPLGTLFLLRVFLLQFIGLLYKALDSPILRPALLLI